jgi:peptide/nickel transport system substrate-binding protein
MAMGIAGAAGASTHGVASAKPKYGGNITLGGSTTPTVNDFTQTNFSGPGAQNQLEVFGSLFVNPAKPGNPFVPDLAQSYKFNKAATQFTVTLKKGIKYSDGTAVTAQTLAWQWGTSRDQLTTAYPLQYLTTVSSITTKGKYTVVVNFTQPDAVFISDIASEPLGLVESPTSLASEGQSMFDLFPVGAGAFKITTDTPLQ